MYDDCQAMCVIHATSVCVHICEYYIVCLYNIFLYNTRFLLYTVLLINGISIVHHAHSFIETLICTAMVFV